MISNNILKVNLKSIPKLSFVVVLSHVAVFADVRVIPFM